jgi:hypothetical protein
VSAKKEKSIKGLILGIIGRVFCVSMMVLTGWTLITLLSGLYLPQKVASVMETGGEEKTDLEKKLEAVKEGMDVREHFHNIDQSIFVEENDPPLCLTCHGNMPHTKALEMRSLLNMHTYFAACEVCHTRKEEGEDIYFAWYDFDTKERIFTLKGAPGSYNAKIVPIRREETGDERRLDAPLNEGFAREFVEKGYTWSLEQKAKAKAIIHEEHTKTPILCNECHAKEGYLRFEDLHYSEKRVEQLEGTEAAGMVEKYIKFYLPTMFDPSLVKKRRAR